MWVRTLDMPVMLAPVPNAIDFSDKKILITDDVADTGKTLKLVHDFCVDTVAEVRSAVIYEKPVACEVRVRVEADRRLDQLPLECLASGT